MQLAPAIILTLSLKIVPIIASLAASADKVHFRIAANVQLAISCKRISRSESGRGSERRRDNAEAQIVSIQAAPDGRDEWVGIVPRISRSLLRRCTKFLLPRNLDPREKRRRLGKGRITHLSALLPAL